MQIQLTLPKEITFPERDVTCRGIKGTDQAELTCITFRNNNTILILDAVVEKDVAPEIIIIQITELNNPVNNIVTDSFEIKTINYEGYGIDEQKIGLEVNFFCMFPCRSCNESFPTIC